MNKEFLDLNKPAIDSFIEFLFKQEKYLNKENGIWDLSNVLLVVPSVRVRREALYQLLLYAQEKNVLLEIPRIVTIGRAPEFLYRQTRPFADDVTQNLAWHQAIKMSDENKRKEYLPSIPDDDDLEGQYLIGQMFSKLHQSLSAEMLDFDDEFINLLLKHRPRRQLAEMSNIENELRKSNRSIVKELEQFQKNHNGFYLNKEIDRWKYFSKIKENYLSILDENNLWDVQVARRYALAFKQPGDFEIDFDIILAGIVDLNQVQKAILDQVSDRVTVLIYAPKTQGDNDERFDKYGALNVEYWSKDLSCPLSDDQIIQVEKPEEQAYCAFEFIRQLSNNFTPDQITIGAPDDKMIPFIQAAAEELGLQIDNSVGQPVTSTAPYALLQALLELLETSSFESFANLVRHPAVYAVISSVTTGSRKDLLSAIDNYQLEYFSYDIPSDDDIKRGLHNTYPDSDIHQDIDLVGRAMEEIRTWLASLLSKKEAGSKDLRKIIELLSKKEIEPKDLQQFVENIFKKFPDEDDGYSVVVKTIIKSSEKLGNISKDFTGKLTLKSVLKLILMRMQSFSLSNGSENSDALDDEQDESDQKSSKPMIHVAGWLELVWDRAPVLAILSLNEGVVPQSINANLFLPNELRKELGILDNNRRFARDAYALKMMAASKSRQNLLAIFSKSDTKGKATLPSRLLFNKDRYISQANVFFDNDAPLTKYKLKQPDSDAFNPALSSRADAYQWAEKNLSGNVFKGVVKSISATRFKDYIECPFRFFLTNVAGIQQNDYALNELPATSFGTIIHQVLNEWANKELVSGNNNWRPEPDQLSDQLYEMVDKLFKRMFPASVLPGIVIQKEIIKQRLRAFAEFQHTWEGKIIAVERDLNQIVSFKDNEEMTLMGRIDRIDLLPNGDIVLLDYKTSGTGKNPKSDHIKKGDWINLQLPIYRRLFLANMDLFSDYIQKETNVRVGYVNISKEKIAKFEDPQWEDSDFESALEAAEDIMEKIHNGIFWPPAKDVDNDGYLEYVNWIMGIKEHLSSKDLK